MTRTLILVGHDTTANTLTWLLYELSKHPGDQNRVRDEIQALRARLPIDAPFTTTDLVSLTFTDATIKVGSSEVLFSEGALSLPHRKPYACTQSLLS